MSAIAVGAPVLEPAAQAFAEATASPPFLPELGPVEARKVLDDVRARSPSRRLTRRGCRYRAVRPAT
jgi:hypothetical protein